jgi:hypothetical protein
VYRNLDRLLEDVTMFPLVAGELGIPGADSVEYILTNPGPDTPVAGGLGASFEEPVHTYHAIELTADKRFRNSWSLHTSYRWSRLRGTVEGFFRDDNGQSDPGITSCRLSNQRSELQSHRRAAVRLSRRYPCLGELEGPLPLDQPHQVNLRQLRVSVRPQSRHRDRFELGKPLTPLAANPSYDLG